MRLFFVGALQNAWEPLERSRGTTTYRIGNDPLAWISNVPHFSRLHQPDLYRGIAVDLYLVDGNLEYDLRLAPNADPRQIRLRFDGATHLAIDSAGNLVINGPDGCRTIQRKPVSYQGSGQSKRLIPTHYRILSQTEAAFDVDPYDRSVPLTIDPIIESISVIGGSKDDIAMAAGPGFVAGMTASPEIPGVLSGLHRGTDVFIHSNSTGNTYIYGGSGDDIVTSVTVLGSDLEPVLLIAGYTDSRDLPTGTGYNDPSTYGGFQTTYGGGAHDGFIIYLQPDGPPTLITYLGGSGDDRVNAATALADGSIVAVGSTTSTDLPLAQAGPNPPASGFIAILGHETPGTGQYIGGTNGSDTPLAVGLGPGATDFYVAGEVRSTDWTPSPGWTGSRQAGADAFVLRFHAAAPFQAPFLLTGAALWGGAGDDRITAIAFRPDGSLALAGVTGSTELPGYHGGPSDAVVLTAAADLSHISGVTLLGGSGADEAASVAVNSFGETAVAGWTNSKDLTQVDPLQKSYGGGASDGLIALFDDSGATVLSSYIGGSGPDQLTSVQFDATGQLVYLAGSTGSNDLPLIHSQQTYSGGLDGLTAVLRPVLIHLSSTITGGQNLVAVPVVSLGDDTNAAGIALTIASSYPSQVTLGEYPDDPGVASLTVSAGYQGNPSQRAFRMYCLTSQGGATLTLTAPGYPQRVAKARCVHGGVVVTPAAIATTIGSSFTINIVTGAVDPETGALIQIQPPRVDVAPVTVSAAPNDSTLTQFGQISTATIDGYAPLTANSNSLPAFSFTAAAVGSTSLQISASHGWTIYPGSSIPVTVSAAQPSFTLPPAAKGLISQIVYGVTGTVDPSAILQFTSSDPSKVLLTTNPSIPGQASLSVGWNCPYSCVPVYLDTIDSSGPASITATLEGAAPVTVPVVFRNPVAGFTSNFYNNTGPTLATDTLIQGQPGAYRAIVWWGPPQGFGYFPGLPYLDPAAQQVQFQILNSNPAVVSAPSSVTWTPGTNFLDAISVTGLSPGTSTLTLQSDQMPATSQALTLTVLPLGLTTTDATVGMNLQVPLQFVSAPNSTGMTFTSSDPSRIVLSLDPNAPGQPSISVTSPSNGYSQIYAQALAGSGDVAIQAAGSGLAPTQTTVHLAPSGFAWNNSSVSPGQNGIAAIAAWMLDPATLTTQTVQQLRPGATGTITIESSNPAVATVNAPSIDLSTLTTLPYSVPFTAVGPGQTLLSIVQPDGFTTPAGRQPLAVTISPSILQFSPASVGTNLQATGTISLNNGPGTITLTSSDPSKLILSTNFSQPGSSSVTLAQAAGGSYQTFYYQAVGGPGDVVVTAAGAGILSTTQVVSIQPSVLAFYEGFIKDPVFQLATEQAPVTFQISTGFLAQDSYGRWGVSGQGMPLSANFTTLPVTINSSNPSVAAILNDPVPFNGLTGVTNVQLQALSSGTTQLSIAVPPGFRLPPPGSGRSAQVNVMGTSFNLPDTTLAGGLQTQVSVQLPQGSGPPPSPVDVTVTSSDPSSVVLSSDGKTLGSGSVTVHLSNSGFNPYAPLYVQGLKSSGSVTLQITAPGYAPATAAVSLTSYLFVPASSPVVLRLGSGGPYQAMYYAVPFGATGNPNAFQFRPGISSFDVTATSSDPTVFTLPVPTVQINPGDSQIVFNIQPSGAGTATLALNLPSQPTQIQVQAAFINWTFSQTAIPRDFQTPFGFGFSGAPSPAQLTITSSDPSKVLISGSPLTAGQASVVVSGSQPMVYAQALAASGTVTLTATAPGYQTATITLTLTSPAIWMQPYGGSLPTISTLSAPVSFIVALGTRNTTGQTLRPGAPPVAVAVSSLEPVTGTVSPAQLTFNAGDNLKTFVFQPLAAGSTLLTASIPDGYTAANSDVQQLITVLAPRLNFLTSLSVGKDAMKNVNFSLIGGTASPAQMTFTSSDPGSLLLSADPNSAPGPAATVTLNGPNANGYISLIGLADSGSPSISISSAGFPPVSYTVSLEPSGFCFSMPQQNQAQVGQSVAGVISMCDLTPQSLILDGFAVLRPGAAPVTLAITSSDPSVVPNASAVINPGVTQSIVYFSSIGKGSTVLTINAPPGYSQPASSSATVSITVQ